MTDNKNCPPVEDMTMRDYFAIEALNARISAMSGLYDPIYVAEQAYELADAMLKVRSEQ